MSTPTLSLCMIVKDEEAHLSQCLQSVQSVVDEWIIVDTGSTDATVEIAKQFGAKVYSFDWVDDFSAARNYAIEQATSDYILVLDADEYFEPGVDFKRDLENGFDCYTVSIKNVLDSNVHYHHAIRLFKNRIGLQYRGRIHEHLNIEDFPQLKMNQAGPTLIHVGYTAQIYHERNKHERNLPLLERAVKEDPSGYNYYNLAKQYKSHHEYDKALDAFKKSFAKSKDRLYITSLLSSMIDCLRYLKRYPEGIRLALDAIDSFPRHTELYYRLGELYKEQDHLEDALLTFHKCLELGEVDATERLAGVGSYLARRQIGEIYLSQGKRTEAMEAAFHAIQEEKSCQEAVVLYLQVLSQSKVPLDMIYENLQKAYPLKTGQDVLNLVKILYILRHPLLNRLLVDYQIPDHKDLQVIAKQYSGQYEAARQIWLSLEKIEVDKAKDVLLLAVYLQDEDLFACCKPLLNFSQKEWKTLRKAVIRESSEGAELTDAVSKVLLEMCTKAMMMEEFAAFEALSAWVMHSASSYQLTLAKQLQAYGYLQPAVELLLKLQQREPMTAGIYLQLGDLCLQMNQLQDALKMYLRAFDLQKEFPVFERLYRLYANMQDEVGMQKVKREMKARFPLSEWVKSL